MVRVLPLESGVTVAGKRIGWTECPILVGREAAERYARGHRPVKGTPTMKKVARLTTEQATAIITARGLETQEKALAARADLDAEKWGESEREPSRKLNAGKSHALLINSIAVYDVANIDDELRAAAGALMTADDRAYLRTGG